MKLFSGFFCDFLAIGFLSLSLSTFRAVKHSTWGDCPQVLRFTTVWDTPGKGKFAKWSSAPASILEGSSEIYAVYGPRKPCKTRGKRQSCQIDPCLPPYCMEPFKFIRNCRGVQKRNKVPWKTGMLIYFPVTSRPLIFPQKEAVLSRCNFATAHLTACILNFYLP